MDILCIHGAGESAAIWQALTENLPDTCALNLPSHGGTAGPGRDSAAAYADWVDSQVSGSDQVILAGHSMGGAIALDLALRPERPSWLRGLILVGTGARLRVHPTIFTLLDTDFDAAVDLMAGWSIGDQALSEPESLLRRDLQQSGREVVRADYGAANAFDVMENLQSVAVPALVVVGANDRMTPPKYAEYLAARIPNTELLIIPGAGHMVTLERPDQVVAGVRDFRKRVEADARP